MIHKVDLHVHSKHSSVPAEWYLRQVKSPESYTEPRTVYRRARERGMDFVTISDHDSIAGALEIAHLPGVFLSCEVTASFPEDGCDVHCLVFGITEGEHREIQELRRNLYELRDYLRERSIAHSIAHPLFRVNGRLTLDHFEKLVVLFDRFEALNGMHDRRTNEVARRILSSLTRKAVEDAAERHGLEPFGETPWVKRLTGGSDDHGGYYIATTFTRVPAAASVEELIEHLRWGRCEPAGESGSSARLTQSFYGIGYEYYRRLFPALLGNRKDPFAVLLRELAEGPRPRPASVQPWRQAALWVRQRLVPRASDRPAASPLPAGRFAVRRMSRLGREAFSRLLRRLAWTAGRGRIAGGLGELSQLAPLAVAFLPHLVSVRSLHKDADLLEEASLRFLGSYREGPAPDRRAWFTDSAGARGEVAARLRVLSLLPGAGEVAIVVAARSSGSGRTGGGVAALDPLSEIPLPPALGGGRLAVPHLLEVLDHCERERYSEIVVDSAGPSGLAGLFAGRLLGLRLSGLFDTDLPSRLREATGSESLEAMAWSYLRWFFGSLDLTYVGSLREQQALVARGFDPRRLRLLPATRWTMPEGPRHERTFALESFG